METLSRAYELPTHLILPSWLLKQRCDKHSRESLHGRGFSFSWVYT